MIFKECYSATKKCDYRGSEPDYVDYFRNRNGNETVRNTGEVSKWAWRRMFY